MMINVTSPALIANALLNNLSMFRDKTQQTPSEKLVLYVDSSATGHIDVATYFTVDHD